MWKRLAVLALIAAVSAVPALAVQATTQVNVNMPSLLILYYRSAVTFDVTSTNLQNVLLTGANPNDEGPVTLSGFGGDAGVTGADFSSSGTQATVQNFWGVRSIAAPGQNTQVTVSFSSATLSNGTDTISLSNIATDLAGAGGFAAAQVTFPPTGFLLQLGDVQFDVDLSSVSTPGSYTGGSILIDAVNI